MSTKSDFQAAEEIKAVLNGREKGEQERIIRWVGESLGIVPTPAAPPPEPQSHSHHPSSTTPAHQPVTPGTTANIKTFLNSKKPKSEIQVATVIAYFFRYEAPPSAHKESITAKELNDASRQGRGVGFKDALKTLSNGVSQGYFDRAGRGAFSLNAVGENLVAMALPGVDSPKK